MILHSGGRVQRSWVDTRFDGCAVHWLDIYTHILACGKTQPTRKTHLCQRRERHRFFHQAFLFADRRQSVWIGIWKWHTKNTAFACCVVVLPINYRRLCQYLRYTDATNDWKSEKRRNVFIHLTWRRKRIVLRLCDICVPQFELTIVCVLRKLSVGSGSDFESLWHEPGRCVERKERFYVQCELFALSLRSHGMSHAAETSSSCFFAIHLHEIHTTQREIKDNELTGSGTCTWY